jgi:hypothetical protein
MRPPRWPPSVELSPAAQALSKRIRRAQWCVCLRQHRHTRCAAAFPQALLTRSKDQPQGHPPLPPAPLALATLRQADTQVCDDAVSEATVRERRWQRVLACLDGETPPCSQGPLVAFRQRVLAPEMARRLLERPGALAATSGACGARQVRAALASSPRWGAGRVEDTSHLGGHALRQAVGVRARPQGRGRRAGAEEAGAVLGAGPSRTAALDLEGDAAAAQQHALPRLRDALRAVEHWLAIEPLQEETGSRAGARLAVAH